MEFFSKKVEINANIFKEQLQKKEKDKPTKEFTFNLEQLLTYIADKKITDTVFYAKPYRKFDGNGNVTTQAGDMVTVDKFGQVIPLVSVISPVLSFIVKETITRQTIFDQDEIVYAQSGNIRTWGINASLDQNFNGKYGLVDEIYYRPKNSEPKDWILLYNRGEFFID